MTWESRDELDALADNRTALWNHGHGIWEHEGVPMSEIKRYGVHANHKDYKGWTQFEHVQGKFVEFSDHEAALSARDSQIEALKAQVQDKDRELQTAANAILEAGERMAEKDRQIAALTAERDKLRKVLSFARSEITNMEINLKNGGPGFSCDVIDRIDEALCPQPPANPAEIRECANCAILHKCGGGDPDEGMSCWKPKPSNTPAVCKLCGQPMPPGEEMFNYHGYSGPCPHPPAEAKEGETQP